MSEIFFIRHAEHTPKGDSNPIGLTEQGIEEARIIGNKLSIAGDIDSICPDLPRFMSTATIALDHNVPSTEINKLKTSFIENKKIKINNNLEYKKVDDTPEFSRLMNNAYSNKQNLRFLYNHSSNFNNVKNPISTSDDMFKEISNIIGSTIHNSDTGNKLVCAREFFFPSFRAHMLEITKGQKNVSDYIDWYSEEIERNDFARTMIAKIAISRASGSIHTIKIADNYGEHEIGLRIHNPVDLRNIFNKENLC